MQMGYRSTRRHEPQKGETLVRSREQAIAIVQDLDKKLKRRLTPNERATYLCAKAVLYEAMGDKQMLEAAQEAFAYSKTAQSCALVAVALHHFGRMTESLRYYEMSWRYPHEAGFEVDIGYSNALLFNRRRWHEAWSVIKTLKKRMVYAAYLPFWNGRPTQEVSVLSEGGFGDLIHNSRWIPKIDAHVTVYLPPYFFESGFADLARRQPWFPEIKQIVDIPQTIPAAGFFDLPAVFDCTPETIIGYPQPWIADPERKPDIKKDSRPTIGFCWAARAMETPLVSAGVYRDLKFEQAERIIAETPNVNWVSLQYHADKLPGDIQNPRNESWEDQAANIRELDTVVTVDTGVAHLAAAMGKKTYVLLSGAVDWKFMLDGNCIWYPSMTVFRNREWGFENSITELISFLRADA